MLGPFSTLVSLPSPNLGKTDPALEADHVLLFLTLFRRFKIENLLQESILSTMREGSSKRASRT